MSEPEGGRAIAFLALAGFFMGTAGVIAAAVALSSTAMTPTASAQTASGAPNANARWGDQKGLTIDNATLARDLTRSREQTVKAMQKFIPELTSQQVSVVGNSVMIANATEQQKKALEAGWQKGRWGF